MADAAAVVAEARRWKETPVRHQGRAPGGGTLGVVVDCLNLVVEVGYGAGALAPLAEAFTYGRLPNPRRLLEGLDRMLVPLGQVEPEDGYVGAFAWADSREAMHLAVMASFEGRRTMIHADARAFPRPRVVEHGYAGVWPSRFRGFWRYPGLS